tara:strand:+ start:8839 stop:9483 length:645 start_codon:yes stop_codon:yes gene_type:complete
MGGIGSGRYGGRPTVEGGLVLDINKLLSDGLLNHKLSSGTLTWSNVRTGEKIASICYHLNRGDSSGELRLKYRSTRYDGLVRDMDYQIALQTTAQRLGGVRWWFSCPRTWRRCAKLYLPTGAFSFASRQAYRLAYTSQRETNYDRHLRQAFKIQAALGYYGGIGDYVPRPKGMHSKTYHRQLAKLSRYEDEIDQSLRLFLGKLKEGTFDKGFYS